MRNICRRKWWRRSRRAAAGRKATQMTGELGQLALCFALALSLVMAALPA